MSPSKRLPQPRLGATGSSAPVLGNHRARRDAGGGTGGLSDAKGAGSQIVERRRDGSSALKAGACGSGGCCSIRRRVLGTVVAHRSIEIVRRDLLPARPISANAMALAIALPVAATTAAAPPTPSFAQLAHPVPFLTRLRRRSRVFFGRSTVMVFVCDRVFWRRLVRESLPFCVVRGSPPRPRPPRPRRRLRRLPSRSPPSASGRCLPLLQLPSSVSSKCSRLRPLLLDFLDWRQLRLLGGEVTRLQACAPVHRGGAARRLAGERGIGRYR